MASNAGNDEIMLIFGAHEHNIAIKPRKFQSRSHVFRKVLGGSRCWLRNSQNLDDILNYIAKLRKFQRCSTLKPKPIQRIGIVKPAIAIIEIFKNLMSLSISDSNIISSAPPKSSLDIGEMSRCGAFPGQQGGQLLSIFVSLAHGGLAARISRGRISSA
jgi:hypothetical protein